MFLNHPSIFDSCKNVDIVCFIETFLEDDTACHLRIPHDSHALFVPGRRGPHSRRASGGFAVLIKNSVARPADCSLVESANGVCVASIRLVNGLEFKIIIAYRAEKAGTPLHNPTFFADLDAAIVSCDDFETVILGDFNTKLGDRNGPLGLLDFAEDLLPAVAKSQEVDRHAEELYEVFASSQLYAFYDDSDGVARDTFQCRDGSGGGSLIDLVLCNSLMYPKLLRVDSSFPCESNHALLVAKLEYEVERVATSRVLPSANTVRMFDLDRLLDLEHSEAILALANQPEDFTVRSAFNAILEFVDQFTEVVTIRPPRAPGPSLETVNAKRHARRVERRLKVERDAAIRRALRAEWIVACDRWRACRDTDAKNSVEEARCKFYDAVRSKDLYRAWRIARRNLAGKGGGIRDPVTAFIDQDSWENHFSSLFAGSGVQLRAPVSGQTSTILDVPFTAEEVAATLEKKKNHRALGPDGFNLDHIRILRYDETTARALANFLNLCVQNAEIPDEWGRAFLFILYKGNGPKDNANSFRGITLKSQLLKLLESMLCDRLRKWSETNRLLPAEQIAYRPGHNGSDHLFSLCLLRDKARACGQSLHASFVDLRKAFPSVDRQKLLQHLSSLGVSDYFLRILTRLYTGDSFQVLLDGQASSRAFQVNAGVHEGSPLSPLLFILFIAGLVRHLRANGGDRFGFRLSDGTSLCCLLYADDVLLLAITREGLQRLLDITCSFFESLGLSINPLKSDVVIFAPLRAPNPTSFTIASLTKHVVDESKYLGVIFHKGGNWKCQLEMTVTRCKMARGRCNIICSSLRIDKPKAMCQIFDMFVSAIYRYSLGSWGVTATGLHKIDNLFCDFVRKQYRLPASTCRRSILMQFARRCAVCDARYLATVQLARGLASPESIWFKVATTVLGMPNLAWVRTVQEHLHRLGLEAEVMSSPGSFLSNRKERGAIFTNWCHNNHLTFANGSSADYFRVDRPFGIYPVIFDRPTNRVRWLLSLLLSCWRWAFNLREVPEYCTECDCMINSWHLMFCCTRTQSARDRFSHQTGLSFNIERFADDRWSDEILGVADSIYRVVMELAP